MSTKAGLTKFLCVALYGVSIFGVALGAGLVKTAEASASYADGTYDAKMMNGQIIFWLALAILYGNMVWGMARWLIAYSHENWDVKIVIGKLIGGGIWRFLAVTPIVLVTLLVITPLVSGRISEHVTNDDTAELAVFDVVEEDLRELAKKTSEMTSEEFLQKFDELTLSNINFGTDASGNIASQKSGWSWPSNGNAYATSNNVKTLNKAMRSSEKNFVIFYTDTGDDAISNEDATEIGEVMERILAGYASIGLEYKYEKFSKGFLKEKGIEEVLKANGITELALEKSMPIYVVNPYSKATNTLATYAGRRFLGFAETALMAAGNLLGMDEAKLYNSAPSYPFVNILPEAVKSESMPIVVAHELGHHFVADYSYDHYGSIGSDEDFIDETTPNLFAINVLPAQPSGNLLNKNHYNENFLGKQEYSLKVSDITSGYPAVAFLQNYYEIVPNSLEIILDATYSGENILEQLYDRAGRDNFRAVMTQLAERNITGDYGGRLVNLTMPKGDSPSCQDACTKQYTMSPASSKYVYLSTAELKDRNIDFTGGNVISGSLLGRDYDGKWKIIRSGEGDFTVTIDDDIERQYGLLVIAASNGSSQVIENFTVKVVDRRLAEILEKDGDYEFDLFKDIGNNCAELNVEEFFSLPGRLLDAGSDFFYVLGQVDGRFIAMSEQIDSEKANVEEAMARGRAEFEPYRVSVCGNYVGNSYSFDEAKRRLMAVMGYNIDLWNYNSGDERWSAFVGLNPLSGAGKIYILGEKASAKGLITINVERK